MKLKQGLLLIWILSVGALLSLHAQNSSYPWLDDVVNDNCCINQTATAYDFGHYSFVYIKANENCATNGKLYREDGRCWCEDKGDTFCLDHYGLSSRVGEVVYECGDAPDFTPFDQFDWLESIIDKENCDLNPSISVYLKNGHYYIFVEGEGSLGSLHYADGDVACTGHRNFECVNLYNLTNETLSWTCGDGQTENDDFVLQLLHYADVDGNEETALASVDEFSALVDGFTNDATYGSQTLFVSSGDIIISGPRFYAAENSAVRAVTGSNEPGHADIAFANYMGLSAAALGNHELDAGPGELADAISPESKDDAVFPGSTFPFLATNVDFSADEDFTIGADGSLVSELGNQVANYATVNVNGELIGLVGATTPKLSSITSTGSLVVSGQGSNSDLAAAIQPSIDALINQGINKIILLAHMQQIAIEKELATLLTGVDIIVAGGSSTGMGDSNDVPFPGDEAFGETYPYRATNANDEPVLVVNVDGDFKYLGRLVVSFDENGFIDPTSLNEDLNGAYASTENIVNSVGGTVNEEVVTLQNAINGVIAETSNNVIGYSNVYLDGRRSQVRTQETNLGNLTADANLWYANLLSDETVDIAIKNGGGIRTDIGSAIIPAGSNDPNDIIFRAPANNAVSQADLSAVLRFDNGLVRLTVTAEELKDIVEHSISATEVGATPGQFPQIAGFSFTYSLSGTARTAANNGSRITKLIVGDDVVVENGVIQGDASRTFNLVSLNFLVNGGDDYPFDILSAPNRVNLYEGTGFGEETDYPDGILSNDPGTNNTFSYTGGEQDALAEYMTANFPERAPYSEAETSADNDKRIIQEFGLTADLMVSGLTYANSDKSLEEANTILTNALNAVEPIRIAAEVVHSDNAASVGQTLNPTKVILFGNPNLGTPIMQKNPLAGLDLPMKFLLFEDEAAKLKIAYNDVSYLSQRHSVGDVETIATIAGALNNFASMVADEGTTLNEDRTIQPMEGITIKVSQNNFEDTYNKLTAAINNNENLRLILELDHSANAASVNLDLPPSRLIVFGNPNLGTPLMQSSQTIGIDLPQKMLVYENEDGAINVAYNNPDFLAARHNVTGNEDILMTITNALNNLSEVAVTP